VWSQRLSQLTKSDLDKVTRLRKDGLNNSAIAKRLNTSSATVSRMFAKVESKASAASS
jgi:IS30 family transposase